MRSEGQEEEGCSHRGLLKATGIIGAMNIAGRAALREAAAQMPATLPDTRLLGAIDMHAHSAPDVPGRSVNNVELARTATERRKD